MKIDRSALIKLQILLRQMCHAPGCDNLRKCPRQCPCRYDRTFELNTETAICWEIAETIKEFLRLGNFNTRVLKKDVEKFKLVINSCVNLTRYHMSRGWQNFFDHAEVCVKRATSQNPHMSTMYDYLKAMKRAAPQLKRYPKED